MKKETIIITIFLLISTLSVRAQQINEPPDYMIKLKTVFDVPEGHHHDFSKPLKNASNELEFLFGLFYWTYKNFISSQDVDSCVFYPSCSTYMILSIQKHGVLTGFLEGMDRLMRCSPFAAYGHYPLNKKIMKYEDPME